MRDFSAQVPVESEKVDWLHDRSVRPARVLAQPSTILLIFVAIFASLALMPLLFKHVLLGMLREIGWFLQLYPCSRLPVLA